MPYTDPYQKYLNDIKYQIEHRDEIKKQKKEHYMQTRDQQLIIMKKYRLTHSEELKQKCRIYHASHREQLNRDAKEYYASHREEQTENNKKYYQSHQKEVLMYRLRTREQRYKKRKEKQLKLKLEAYEILGNKCSNPECAVPGGMTDIRALQIDHINGGGTKEIRKIQQIGIYKKIIAREKGYQILCASCNWIKRHTNNECPIIYKFPLGAERKKIKWQGHL
jgi:hypothetical protein